MKKIFYSVLVIVFITLCMIYFAVWRGETNYYVNSLLVDRGDLYGETYKN